MLAHDGGALTSWDLRALRLLDAVPGPAASVAQLAFDATGTLVAVAGSDASVQVWDGFTGRLRRRLGRHGSPVVAVRFSPDGALLYSLGSDRRVRVWELDGGHELGAIAVDAFAGLDMSRDGSRLLVHQHLGAVSFWDVSREPRPAARVAEVVACLVPLEAGADGRLVARRLPPRCSQG
jgi:WD40 repeat protein